MFPDYCNATSHMPPTTYEVKIMGSTIKEPRIISVKNVASSTLLGIELMSCIPNTKQDTWCWAQLRISLVVSDQWNRVHEVPLWLNHPVFEQNVACFK